MVILKTRLFETVSVLDVAYSEHICVFSDAVASPVQLQRHFLPLNSVYIFTANYCPLVTPVKRSCEDISAKTTCQRNQSIM